MSHSRKYDSYNEDDQQKLLSEKDKKKDFALQWMLIPLTRAIDTLVIQIDNKNHFLYSVLKEIYEEHDGGYIKWISDKNDD